MVTDLNSLRTGLASPEADERIEAARTLAQMSGVAARLAVPLVAAAGDRNDAVRIWAAEALEAMGPPSPADLTALANSVNDARDSEPAYWAATLIGRLGAAAAPVVDDLATALENSPYLAVRERIAWALCRIGPSAVRAQKQLQQACTTESPRLSRLAAAALEGAQRRAA